MVQQMDGRTLTLGSSGANKMCYCFPWSAFVLVRFSVGAYWTSAAFNFESLPPPALLHTGNLSLTLTTLKQNPEGWGVEGGEHIL